MRPILANILERIVTASQERVSAQITRRTSGHLTAGSGESGEKEAPWQSVWLDNFVQHWFSSVLWKWELGKGEATQSPWRWIYLAFLLFDFIHYNERALAWDKRISLVPCVDPTPVPSSLCDSGEVTPQPQLPHSWGEECALGDLWGPHQPHISMTLLESC